MTGSKTRIAINGFGRIGRTILKILLDSRQDFELVLINDTAPLDSCAYLSQYDSVFGPWKEDVEALGQGLKIGSKIFPFRMFPTSDLWSCQGLMFSSSVPANRTPENLLREDWRLAPETFWYRGPPMPRTSPSFLGRTK